MLRVWGHFHKKDVLSTGEATTPQLRISRLFGKMVPQCFLAFNSYLVIYLFFVVQDLGELKEKKNDQNTKSRQVDKQNTRVPPRNATRESVMI